MNSDMLSGDHQHSYISVSVKHSHVSITLRKDTLPHMLLVHVSYIITQLCFCLLCLVSQSSSLLSSLTPHAATGHSTRGHEAFNKLKMKVLRMIAMQTGYHTADHAVVLSGGSTPSLWLKLSRPLYFPLCPLALQLSPTKSWTSLSLALLQISSF